MVRFTSNLISLRKNHNIFTRQKYYKGTYDSDVIPEIVWYDNTGKNADWGKMNRFLSFKLNGQDEDNDFYVATNMDLYDLTLTLPSLNDGKKWYRVVDTSFNAPDDIVETGSEELLQEQHRYVLVSGASVVLMSK